MATSITATLRADITQFERAIQQAETKITGLQKSSAQVNRELAKFGNDFGGANLIRQANSMAKAVEDIGGVTKLTTAEQKRLSGTVDEALAKYRALGQEVPPALTRVSTALEQVRKAEAEAQRGAESLREAQQRSANDQAKAIKQGQAAFSALSSVVGTFGVTLSAAFAVNSVVNFAKDVIALGGQITDLSARMGVGVEAAQELKFALEQTGSSFEAGSRAIGQMNDRLTEGKDSTVAALQALNLEIGDLRSKKPEDAFQAIAEAIKDVPDPMRQTQLAMELFGKAGVEILPAIKQGMSELREEARQLGQVLSEEDVKALDDFGDRWDATMNRMKVGAATASLFIVDAFKQSWTQILKDQAAGIATALGSWEKFRAALQDPTRFLLGSAVGIAISGARTRGGAAAATAPSDDEADALFKSSLRSVGEAAKTAADGVSKLTKEQKSAASEAKKLADEAKKLAAELDKLTGRDAITRAKELQITLSHLNIDNLDPKQAAEVNKAFDLAIKTAERLGDTVPEVWRDIERSTRQPIQATKLFTDAIYLAQPAVKGLGFEMDKSTERILSGLMNVKGGIAELGKEFLAQRSHTVDWADSIAGLSSAFANLAQIGGDGLDGIIGKIADMIGLMSVGAQAGQQLANQFRNKDANGKVIPMGQAGAGFNLDSFRNAAGNFSAVSVAGGAAQAAPAVASGIGALAEATNVKGRGARAGRGALAGAALGGQIAGPYGALVGAAVGALVGAFRNPAFEDVYKRVAKNFGVAISDETAKGIAKLAKDSFKGDRAAAEIFSLDKIIGEGGGIKQSNIDTLTARLRDAFSMKDVGKFSSDQLTEVLEKNYGAFADFVGRSNTIAGKGFAEIARLAKAAGVEVEGITQFVSGQTGRVGGGLDALSQPLLEAAQAFTGAQSNLPDLLRQRDEVARKRLEGLQSGELDDTASQDTEGGREFKALDDELTALNKSIAETQGILDKTSGSVSGAQAEFDRLGIIAVGAFNAARASGLGFLEATDQLGPGLDRLVGIQEQLGLSGNAALSELLKFRDLVGTNETVVASAEALNDTILGLSNIGGLTKETLAALEGQGLETFDRLTAAGFTSGQSIEVMRGFIENLKKAHEQLGVPIDANTQALIDQADALEGLGPKSPAEAMAKGFENVVTAVNRLAKGLGIDVPEAATAAADAVEGATQRTSSAAQDAAEAIAVAGGESWRKYEREATDAQEEIGDAIKRVADRGVFYYDKFADSSEDTAADATQHLRRFWTEYYQRQGDALKDADSSLKDFVTDANESLAKIQREIEIQIRYTNGDVPEPPSGGGDVPGLASGGVVRARPGGTIVRLAEGGLDEAVIPLSGGSGGGVVTVPMLVAALRQINFVGVLEQGGRPLLRYVSREVGPYIETRTGQRVPL